MNHSYRELFFVALCALTFNVTIMTGCKSSAPETQPDEPAVEGSEGGNPDAPVSNDGEGSEGNVAEMPADPTAIELRVCETPDQAPDEGFGSDNYTLTAASIEQNTMLVSVQYSGGCEAHTFVMCWPGSVKETVPAQTSMALWHQDNGDSCEALVSTTLAIDLSELKSAGLVEISMAGLSDPLSYAPAP